MRNKHNFHHDWIRRAQQQREEDTDMIQRMSMRDVVLTVAIVIGIFLAALLIFG